MWKMAVRVNKASVLLGVPLKEKEERREQCREADISMHFHQVLHEVAYGHPDRPPIARQFPVSYHRTPTPDTISHSIGKFVL